MPKIETRGVLGGRGSERHGRTAPSTGSRETVQAVTKITHEDHGAIPLVEGTFVVRIQREWQGSVSRRVED